jgi:hypothetical protein
MGWTTLPMAFVVIAYWIPTDSNATAATYTSSIVRRRMRSMKKKISAETASIAMGVMMYIHGTFWTP